MTHRDDEPKRNPAWRAAVWTVLTVAACLALLLGVWLLLLGNRNMGGAFLGISTASSVAAFFVGRKIVQS